MTAVPVFHGNAAVVTIATDTFFVATFSARRPARFSTPMQRWCRNSRAKKSAANDLLGARWTSRTQASRRLMVFCQELTVSSVASAGRSTAVLSSAPVLPPGVGRRPGPPTPTAREPPTVAAPSALGAMVGVGFEPSIVMPPSERSAEMSSRARATAKGFLSSFLFSSLHQNTHHTRRTHALTHSHRVIDSRQNTQSFISQHTHEK